MYSHIFLPTRLNIAKPTGAALYGLILGAILPPCLIIVEILLYNVFGFEKQAVPAAFDVAATHPHYFIPFAILFAPLFETFVFQVLIYWGTEIAFKNRGVALIVTTLCFSLAHLSDDNSRQAIVALFSGLYFTFIYMQVSNTSKLSAFTTTAVCHATHNTIVCMLGYYLMKYHPNGVVL